ncbi:MAG: DegT/DnrJ/EryC1/StrS family aminotransferase [Deltaproteobacteria bacterium]|nr:DegT/DnrJ/EryC1/StrS family aminotransferase [Deltaproteobacteria bacterium]
MKNIINKKRIPVSKPSLIGSEKDYVLECMDSTWISSNGKYIELFEKKFAEYIGVKHAISCCNGTTALHVALLALGIGPGDEIIIPTLTYVATANAVKYTGAVPVFADSELDTWNIDPEKIEPLITEKTKAIIAVPLYGHPCDMDPIITIAKKHGLFLIEDAAEALGTKYKNKYCGSIANISTFSFYGNKTITTGEGGMVVTDDDSMAAKLRLLKGQGMDPQRRYWFPVIGYNYRMTNIEAAIGFGQLENINLFLEKRRLIAEWYFKCLKGIRGVSLPIEKDYAVHSYWMYSILIEEEFGISRDELMEQLEKYGIETRPVFYPMHIMPVYKEDSQELRNAEEIAAKGINLPTFYELEKEDVEYVAGVLKELCR